MLNGPATARGWPGLGECMASGHRPSISSLHETTIWQRASARGDLPAALLALLQGGLTLGRRAIERQIQRQHVHPRLAEEAESTALHMLLDQLPHAIFRQVAGFR